MGIIFLQDFFLVHFYISLIKQNNLRGLHFFGLTRPMTRFFFRLPLFQLMVEKADFWHQNIFSGLGYCKLTPKGD